MMSAGKTFRYGKQLYIARSPTRPRAGRFDLAQRRAVPTKISTISAD
jgi:hypothetical protein